MTLSNRLGKFDVLPEHANLISVIYESILVYTIDGRTDVYFFNRGIIEVSQNKVRLFLEGKID